MSCKTQNTKIQRFVYQKCRKTTQRRMYKCEGINCKTLKFQFKLGDFAFRFEYFYC